VPTSRRHEVPQITEPKKDSTKIFAILLVQLSPKTSGRKIFEESSNLRKLGLNAKEKLAAEADSSPFCL
jgi:hypothetical protein